MTKKILKLFLTIVTLLIGVAITDVKAEEAKETLSISNYEIGSEPITFPDNALNSEVKFHVKKTADGKYIYCVHYAKKPPVSNIIFNKGDKVEDAGINYILRNGANAKNDTEFFKYQTALWIYLVETNQMEGVHKDIDRFINTIASSNDSVSKEIRSIVDKAKVAVNVYMVPPTVSIESDDVEFTLKGNYYVSDKIKVNIKSNSGKEYKVTLTNVMPGAKVEQEDDYFIIKVPASKIDESREIGYSVTVSDSYTEAYYYTPSDSKYQVMAASFNLERTASDGGEAYLEYEEEEEEEPIITKIIKTDAETGEVLSGAKLQLTNQNGKIIKTWTTTTSAREFEDLAKGTYTLVELEAPKGYVKSDEKVIFKINSDGELLDEDGNEISKVVFTNKKEEEPKEPEKVVTGVKISKQDITNKKELPGATLVIKDYDGNVKYEFISTTEPTFVELVPGIYTLTETIAPEGYILSSETITFTVKEDGTIDTVVMYNTPNAKEEVVVENTASFTTITSTVIGLIVSVLGMGLIFKKPKKLV